MCCLSLLQVNSEGEDVSFCLLENPKFWVRLCQGRESSQETKRKSLCQPTKQCAFSRLSMTLVLKSFLPGDTL